jgi:NAD(P)H-flavin reductase
MGEVVAVSPRRALFVAGGVGVNPLIAMLRHLDCTGDMPSQVDFVYSTKALEPTVKADRVLFLPELMHIVSRWRQQVRLHLFVTGQLSHEPTVGIFPHFTNGRLKKENLEEITRGNSDGTVAYVCGPPDMTDELVSFLQDGMEMPKGRVLCEKWW